MNMPIRPILSALGHHKAGALLIVLQIALTLAIVCNALFIISQRIEHVSRPTGIDEADVLVVSNEWIGKPPAERIDALMTTDLAVLRQLPGVADAYASNASPLSGNGRAMGLNYTPDQVNATTRATVYFADEHALNTLGVKLVAGRNFRVDEISRMTAHDPLAPPAIIVTQELAAKMFPNGSALGKQVYMYTTPSTIVGVVEKLQGSFVTDFANDWSERSLLVPHRLDTAIGYYLVRAKPGQLDAVAASVAKALYAANGKRVIERVGGVQRFSEIRSAAYARDIGMAILMGIISVVLLAITAAGIVGLTSFWVGQRRKQIGVRRALGATRNDILGYFLTENLLISLGGVVLGVLLAISLNLWMVTHEEMARLSLAYLAIGVLVLLLLGQGAVLAPALRASRVSPVEATRSV